MLQTSDLLASGEQRSICKGVSFPAKRDHARCVCVCVFSPSLGSPLRTPRVAMSKTYLHRLSLAHYQAAPRHPLQLTKKVNYTQNLLG